MSVKTFNEGTYKKPVNNMMSRENEPDPDRFVKSGNLAELYKFLSDYYGRNNRLFNPVALKDVDTAAISNQYNHLLELKNAIANGLPPTKLQAILYRIALASIKLTTNLPLGAQRDNFVKL